MFMNFIRCCTRCFMKFYWVNRGFSCFCIFPGWGQIGTWFDLNYRIIIRVEKKKIIL